MQEYTSPGEVAVAPDENLTHSLWEAVRTNPDRPAVAHRVGDRFVEWSTRQFADEVSAVAKGLMGLGVEHGDKVCIYSGTRLEWTVLDYAIWAAGGTTVPIYETSSAEQVEWIVSDSGRSRSSSRRPSCARPTTRSPASCPAASTRFVIDDGALEQVKQAGTDVSDEDLRAARTRHRLRPRHDRLHLRDHRAARRAACSPTTTSCGTARRSRPARREFFQPGERTLLFLPLAHIFARIIQTSCIRAGVTLGFSTGDPAAGRGAADLQADLPARGAARVREGLQRRPQKAEADGKGKIFDKAAHVAEQYSREQAAGKIGFGTKLKHGLFDKLVYGKLRNAMGGNVRYAVSGGAALGERLGHFFNGIGVTILEGYGLTETTAGACINRPTPSRSARSASPSRARRSGSPRTARSCSRAGTSSRATTTTTRPPARS
jgi:long-chain acyl-CoA synthetase